MAVTIDELAQAREIASELLDELGLPVYLFEIEPLTNSQWELRLEFKVDESGTWETITLPILRETLLSSHADKAARQVLLNKWQDIIKVHSSTS